MANQPDVRLSHVLTELPRRDREYADIDDLLPFNLEEREDIKNIAWAAFALVKALTLRAPLLECHNIVTLLTFRGFQKGLERF